jgi:hypothetical protein
MYIVRLVDPSVADYHLGPFENEDAANRVADTAPRGWGCEVLSLQAPEEDFDASGNSVVLHDGFYTGVVHHVGPFTNLDRARAWCVQRGFDDIDVHQLDGVNAYRIRSSNQER